MDFDKKIHKQLKHSFYLHSEYIHFDEQFEDDDDEIDVDEDEFDQWMDDEKEGINDADRKLDSDFYPQLSTLDAVFEKIHQQFPNLTWNPMTEPPIQGKEMIFHFAKVYTANGNGLLEFTIQTEDNMVYLPLRVDVSITDYPYSEVRKMAKENNWYLYHLNAFEYLDVEDDSETGKDLISPIIF
ncbi:MAG: hypothetical protein WCK67_08435 [bacterium]